ncbi:MAG TPA: glutathione S-transferase family protein [Steroidobacteraceae bacterium]|nr:glutathione S-transferase family protein [Steroidobacteraceae bacterium]
MEAIEIIGAAQSAYVRTTRMAFEEKGVPYSLKIAAPHSSLVNALHPFGKIPVMRHGSFTLFESKAIATYIDRKFEGPALVPDDAESAALVEQWISAINTSIFPTAVVYMQANVFPKGPNGTRDEDVVAETLPQVGRHIEILDGAVAPSGHLAGKLFTLADMYLMPMLAYLRLFPESAAMIVEASNLDRYFAQHSKRKSFAATAPPPLEELRQSRT